jgi:hypothetical protein
VSIVSGTPAHGFAPEFDDGPLLWFEAEVWKVAGRKLSPLEVDRICLAHERAVDRALASQLHTVDPPKTRPPRPAVPYEVEL